MLVIKDLSYQYRFGQTAFTDVSFGVNKGEIFCIYGDKDSGKTSLLLAIAGAFQPNQGSILIDGKCVNKLPNDKKSIFLYREYGGFFENRSLMYNLAYPFLIRKADKTDTEKTIRSLANIYDLSDMLYTPANKLTPRSRMLAQFIRCKMRKPEICLFDDPIVCSDHKIDDFRLLLSLFDEIKKDSHIVFATSSMKEVMALNHKTLFLHFGNVQQMGTLEEMKRLPLTCTVFKSLYPATTSENAVICSTGGEIVLKSNNQTYLLNRKNLLNEIYIDKNVYVLTNAESEEKWIYDYRSEALIYFETIR